MANWRVSQGLSGDIDGDGNRDRVYVAAAESNPCDLLLVVHSPIYYSLRFEIPCAKPAEAVAARPFVKDMADIDTVPGLEIVVEIGHGASWKFARLFTVRAHSLHPITLDDAPDHLTLAYYGSVGTGDRYIDCAAKKGFAVSTSRSFAERSLVRTRYRITGTELKRLGSKRMPLPDGDAGFRELRGPQPFPSCTRVRRAAPGTQRQRPQR